MPTSTLQKWAIAIEILFPLVSLVLVALRTFVRIRIKSFGWGEWYRVLYVCRVSTDFMVLFGKDDGLIIVALVLAIGLAVSTIIGMCTWTEIRRTGTTFQAQTGLTPE